MNKKIIKHANRKNKIIKEYLLLVLFVLFMSSFAVFAAKIIKINTVGMAFAGGDGSPGNPFQIQTCLQLQDMNLGLDKNYILISSFDCGGIANFKPIGGDDPNWLTVFSGSFDGKGYTISNLKMNRVNPAVGLFGFASNSIIKNVNLVSVNLVFTGNQAGALIGHADGTTVTNCNVQGTVSGNGRVGGFAGYMGAYSKIINCSSNVALTSGGGTPIHVGGLVGYNTDHSLINNSYSKGTINGGSQNVGGLVGNNEIYSDIINSSSSININTGGWYIGGLVGLNTKYSRIINSSSSGTMTMSSGTEFGGLAGANREFGEIISSYSSSNIQGNFQDCGGLVGYNGEPSSIANAKIIDSYATGNIIASASTNTLGGLVGTNQYGIIQNSYATGTVNPNGGTIVGGLVGTNQYIINNSFSTSTVSGSGTLGGLVGNNAVGLIISNSFYNNPGGLNCVGSGSSVGCTAINNNISYFQGDVFKKRNPFITWPFFRTWQERINNYPVLTWQNLGININQKPDTQLIVLNTTNNIKNDTYENLTCYANLSDADINDIVYANFTWYNNSVKFSEGQYGPFSPGTLTLISTLYSNYTNTYDNWTCSIQAYDSYEYELDQNNATIYIVGRPGFERCGELSEKNKVYTLQNDIIDYPLSCFNITANNVTLDGNNHRLLYTKLAAGEMFGIYSNQNNTVIKNLILEEGSSVGGAVRPIYFYGVNNGSIKGNTIITHTGPISIVLYNGVSYTNITDNNISDYGDDSTGIHFQNDAGAPENYYNNLINNTIVIGGLNNGGGGIGMFLSGLFNSNIENNTIYCDSDSGQGITATSVDFYNTISSNKINITGTSGYGFYLTGVWSLGNIFLNNNISTLNGGYSFYEFGSTMSSTYIVYNNSYGDIRWPVETDPFGISEDLNFPGNIVIRNNTAYVNSSAIAWDPNNKVNVTLDLSSWTFMTQPYVVRDGIICKDCYNFTPLINSIVKFNISSWGNYTINDPYLLTNCKNLDETGANYSLISDVVSDGTCFMVTADNVTFDGQNRKITYAKSGTSANYGISSNSSKTVLKNLNIEEGNSTGSDNHAIYFVGSSNGVINNSIIKTYSQNSYGLWLNSYSEYNNINYNSVTVSGTSSIGIQLSNECNFNNISYNILEAQGYSEIGMVTYRNSSYNKVINNFVTCSGTSPQGIWIGEGSNYNEIEKNNVLLTKEGGSGMPLYLCHDNLIKNNSITHMGEYGKGISLNLNSSYNMLSSNDIKTIGYEGYGIYIDFQSEENTLLNNQILSLQSYEINDLSNPIYKNYLIYNNSFGEIRWTKNEHNLTIKGDLTFPGKIIISNNSAYVRGASFEGNIDSPANVTLNLINWNFVEPILLKDGSVCTDCYNFTSLKSSKVKFNVSGWTTYRIGEKTNFPPSTNLVILNSTDPSANDTYENLTCYASISDPNGGNVYANVTWYNNSAKFSEEQTGPLSQGTLNLFSTLSNENLNVGDIWYCSVQAYDGQDYEGAWTDSNTIEILIHRDRKSPVFLAEAKTANSIEPNTNILFYLNLTDKESSINPSSVKIELEDPNNFKFNNTMQFNSGDISADSVSEWFFEYTPSIAGMWYAKFYAADSLANAGSTIDRIISFEVKTPGTIITTGGGGGGGGGGGKRYQCSDGLDNDGDKLVDMKDLGCKTSYDDDEYNIVVTEEACQEMWVCSKWKPKDCPSSGTQIKDCFDQNSCGTQNLKPQTARKCTYSKSSATCYDGILNQDEEDTDCGGSCEPCKILFAPLEEKPNYDWLYAMAALVFISVFIVIGIYSAKKIRISKNQKTQQDIREQQIIQYVQRNMAKGYQKEDLKRALINVGWDQEYLEQIFNKLH